VRTNAKAQHKHLARRKASTWSVPAPRLRDLPLEALQWLLFHLLGLLPITFVSNLGGFLAGAIVPRLYPRVGDLARANLSWLEPGWSEARVRETAARMIEGIGRLRAEYSILHRLIPSGRVRIENGEAARAVMAAGPVILVGMHTANWELIAPVMAGFGRPFAWIYEPQDSRMQTYLALKVRTAAGNVTMLSPSPAAARAALRTLKAGGTLALFCDEAVGGLSSAPFLGRPPHLDSNYAIAVRLARKSGATLLPFHVTRHPGCRFTLRFGAPIALAPTDEPGSRLLDDVVHLNAVVEPEIRAHLDQWYFVPWPFAGRS